MLRYFTVITNLLVAIVFSAIALDIRRLSTPFQLAGVTIAIMLVGVVYGLLLRGMVELSGGALLADTLNHVVTPILVPLYWVLLAPKGYVRARDPWLWTLLPLAYFAYALVRGASEGLYAYPFIDLPAIGWTQLLVNAAVMALGFIAAGHVLFWLDGRLSRTRPMVIG